MKKLLTRGLTGAIFVAVMVFSILWSRTLLFNLLLVVTCIGLYEFNSVLQENGIRLPAALFYIITLTAYFLVYMGSLQLPVNSYMFVIVCLMLLFFVAALFQKEEDEAFRNLGYIFISVWWIVFPFALMNFFPFMAGKSVAVGAGQWLLLVFFITIWANDTFAYLTGSLIGKHPFFERISPKKTWEGTLGGGILALLLSLFYTRLFPFLSFSMLQWLGFALIVVVMGTIGDLVESFFKRRMHVKASGTLLPGHGGILDRFDSAMFAAPFVLLYLQLIC